MQFPSHLLDQARHLATYEKSRPRQASLRRAISTAYYALFHLLIHEATLNWKRISQRTVFARLFEHGKMKVAAEKQRGACDRYLNDSARRSTKHEAACMGHLRAVAHAFVEAQQDRHRADYDNAKMWSQTEALARIDAVRDAFKSWRAIRNEDIAQDFLLSLLGPRGVA